MGWMSFAAKRDGLKRPIDSCTQQSFVFTIETCSPPVENSLPLQQTSVKPAESVS